MRNRAAPDARQSTGATGHDGLRLLVLTQYYHPEVGAAQTRLRETVIGLRRRGFRVTVLAPVPSYPLGLVPEPYAWWRPTRERIDGARVMRLPTIAAPGAGMSRRMIAHATFALTSLAGLAVAGRFDVVLVESPPLLLALPARTLMASGVPYVFHVADPWPDFPIAMGYLQSRLERRLAFGLEDLAYRGAAAITTSNSGRGRRRPPVESSWSRTESTSLGLVLDSLRRPQGDGSAGTKHSRSSTRGPSGSPRASGRFWMRRASSTDGYGSGSSGRGSRSLSSKHGRV
jgi:hypothetical protein